MTFEELNAARDLQQQIDGERRRLNRLRTSIFNITPAYDGLPRTRRLSSKIELMTIKIITVEERIADLNRQLETARAHLLIELQRLPLSTRELDVVTCRYVACMSFRTIRFKLHHSEGYLFKLHRRALKKILQRA